MNAVEMLQGCAYCVCMHLGFAMCLPSHEGFIELIQFLELCKGHTIQYIQ